MTSALSITRELAAMDAKGWSLVGMDADGPGWMQFMRDDEHPLFLRQYRKLRDRLFEEEESVTWH